MTNELKNKKVNKLKLKNKQLHSAFVKEIKKILPCLSIGMVCNKDNSPKYLEVIVYS